MTRDLASSLPSVAKASDRCHTETYDPGKLYASIYATCQSANCPDGVADQAARQVSASVTIWSRGRTDITSTDIRTRAERALRELQPEAAAIYRNYRKII